MGLEVFSKIYLVHPQLVNMKVDTAPSRVLVWEEADNKWEPNIHNNNSPIWALVVCHSLLWEDLDKWAVVVEWGCHQ